MTIMDDRSGRLKYAERLVRSILENPDYYFSNGYLNSEGWKVVGLIFKTLSRERPQISKIARKLRENPSYSNVVRVLEDVINMVKQTDQREL